MAKRLFGILFLFGFLAAAAAGAAVPKYGTAEIVLRSTNTYNAASGTPNPFIDVDLTARVTAPSGKVYNARGFFDGDGAGGAVGNVFKVRVHADEAGSWAWATTSNAAGLNGRSGRFDVSGTLPGVFGRGPVVRDPQHPRSFMYRDGTPVYLLGKFLDHAVPSPLRYSHTLLSEKLTDADRQAMLNRHVGMRLNKMNVYLANRGDYGGMSTTPWVGSAAANDKRRFDLARWRTFDRWVVALRDAGLVAQLWVFADDSGFGDLADADRRRLVDYAMARLSGYSNTMFTLVLEWQEGWSTSEVGSTMTHLHSRNVWDRLASVHGVTGDFSFPSASWADYLDTQAGNEAAPSSVHAHGLRNRALAAKPLIQEEFGLGQEDTVHRQRAWAAFSAGAAGSGTGAFLRQLATFVAAVPFQRMAPADRLALSGNAWVLAEAGKTFAAYLPSGGTLQLDLGGAAGVFTARWFDPRTGTFRDAGRVDGGAARSFTAPAAGDWALLLVKDASAPVPPPPAPEPPPPTPEPEPEPEPPSYPLPTNPNAKLTRAEIGVMLVWALRGRDFVPPAATGLFADVPVWHPAAPYLEQLYRDGVTRGCAVSPLRYCPQEQLSRAQMAVFLLRVELGRGYAPGAPKGVFADVPKWFWAAPWIERLYQEGITEGCATNPLRYCPYLEVSKWEAETFLSRTDP